MIPAVSTLPANTVAIPPQNVVTSQDLGNIESLNRSSQISIANLNSQAPLTSPDLHSTPALTKIAQSELPGDSTPRRPNSTRDTGNGYPTRIPANYVGPGISFANGGSAFGVVSRFKLGEQYSLRPSATFGSKQTTVRVPVTYNFAFGEPEPFEPSPIASFHAGGGVEFTSGGGTVQGDKFSLLGTVGVDLNLFDGVAILADVNTNFASNTGVTVGIGFEF